MAEPRRLRVPRGHERAFTEFASLSDTSAEAILDLLDRDPPILGDAELERMIVEVAPETAEIIEPLIQALTALIILRTSHEWGVDEVAEGIAAAENLELDESLRQVLADRLRGTLDATTLSVNAKAADLSVAHERIFHIARVVTEARPVFGRDVSAPPVGTVISHFLELGYFRAGDRDVDAFIVGLSTDDLGTLSGQLRRAEEKAASLETYFESQGLYVFDGTDDDQEGT